MADLFDYLKWRGDLSFTVSDFNEIDALILCQLTYIDFSDIISSEVKTQKSLKQVAEEFSTHKNLTEKSDLGLIINPKTIDLLYKTANSQRFSDILICGYESIYNLQIEEQFSAITFLIDKEKVFVEFLWLFYNPHSSLREIWGHRRHCPGQKFWRRGLFSEQGHFLGVSSRQVPSGRPPLPVWIQGLPGPFPPMSRGHPAQWSRPERQENRCRPAPPPPGR